MSSTMYPKRYGQTSNGAFRQRTGIYRCGKGRLCAMLQQRSPCSSGRLRHICFFLPPPTLSSPDRKRSFCLHRKKRQKRNFRHQTTLPQFILKHRFLLRLPKTGKTNKTHPCILRKKAQKRKQRQPRTVRKTMQKQKASRRTKTNRPTRHRNVRQKSQKQ